MNPGTADRHVLFAGHGRTFVLSAAAVDLGCARRLRVRRGAVRTVLRRARRPSQSAAGDVLPAAADWVLRRH